MDQLAINMLGIAPAVFPACIVRNCETSADLQILDLFDDVRIEAVARLHLAEHNVFFLNLIIGIDYWLVCARVPPATRAGGQDDGSSTNSLKIYIHIYI